MTWRRTGPITPTVTGGHHIRPLVDTCLDFVRPAGYRRMRLWTNEVLVTAAGSTRTAGFALVHEEAHHRLGVDLVGQTYERDLAVDG